MVIKAEDPGGKRRRKRTGRKKRPMKDLPKTSEIEAFFPYPGLGRLALASPGVLAGIGAYMLMEAAQPWWGPPVYEHGRQTRRQLEEGFSRTGTEIDPLSPWFMPPEYVAPGTRARKGKLERAEVPTKRKVSKANKAFKKAYKFVTKGFKGKMTQKKCRYFMRKASKMAGRANPHTKSRIGKSKNAITRHCRKIRKGVWGVTKHA